MDFEYLYVFVVVLGIVMAVREVLISRERDEGLTPNLLIYIGLILSSIGFYFDHVFDYGYLTYTGMISGIIFIIGSIWKGEAKDISKKRLLEDYLSLGKNSAKSSSIIRPKIHAKFLKRYGVKKASVYISLLFIAFMLGLLGAIVMLGSYTALNSSWIDKMLMTFWLLFTIGIGALMYVETSSRLEWLERQRSKR